MHVSKSYKINRLRSTLFSIVLAGIYSLAVMKFICSITYLENGSALYMIVLFFLYLAFFGEVSHGVEKVGFKAENHLPNLRLRLLNKLGIIEEAQKN